MANSTDGLSDGGGYHGIIQFQQWADASGGGSAQIAITDNNNVWHRGSSGALSSWSSWYKFLDSGNYNSYSPTLTGTGASGTWGINITGTANGLSTGAVTTGPAYFRKNQSNGDYTTAALWTESYGTTTTGIAFHISGTVGKFLEMRTNGTLYWNGNVILNDSNYNSYSPTLTGTGASGTWGINITGNAATATTAGSATTATNSSQLQGLSKAQLWNNSGQNHGTYQAFSAVPDFGQWFVQNSGAGDSPAAGSQYYVTTTGLGNDYAYGTYGLMTAVARDFATKYTWYRTQEGGTWGAWTKGAAGYADTAGSAQNATFLTQPNASWGARVQLGGNGSGSGVANIAVVQATDGNLHIDSGLNKALYLNYYHNGTIYLNGATYYISGNGSQYNGNAATATLASNSTNLGGYAPNTTGGVSTIVQRDTNGYIQNSYFYTSGGGTERNASGMGYFAGFNSSDYYIRSYTPQAVATAISGSTMNISGSATSAISATYLNGSNYIARRGSAGNYNTDFQNTAAGSVSHQGDDYAITNNPGNGWWFVDNYRHSNSSNYWGTQVAWGWEDNANRLATRNIQGGAFGSWVYYLNSANYTSYAPSLTGSGASGTWGINITGNAATATVSSSITGQANSATITASVSVTSDSIVQRNASGYIYANHINFSTSETENPSINSFLTSNGDGWSRKSSLDHVKNSIRGVADGTWGIRITGFANQGSQRLYSTDPTYNYDAANPYFGYLTFDGSRWLFQVSPGTPAAVRVAYSDSTTWSGILSRPSNIMFYEGFTLNADSMSTNSTGFTYAINAPHVGPIARFSANTEYDLEINAAYSNTGISYRAKNGDTGSWQAWNSFITSANIGSQTVALANGVNQYPNRTDGAWYQINWTNAAAGDKNLYSSGNILLRSSGYGAIGWNGSAWYIEGNATYGLYSNTGFYAAGGLWDAGNRVYSAGNPQTSITGNAASATTLTSTQSNWASTGVISNVVGMLSWKNYSNGHVIFDASGGTTPSGTSCSNTNAAAAWTGTYPTLMGWNGSTTYGVRVDSARVSDTTGSISGFNNPTTAATGNTIVYRDGNGDDFRRYGFAAYFNMSHGESGATGDTVFYSSSDDYIRKNNATGFRASLNVPTRTGGDASGTWGINITGNAATATYATSAGLASSTSANYISTAGGLQNMEVANHIGTMTIAYIGASGYIGNNPNLSWNAGFSGSWLLVGTYTGNVQDENAAEYVQIQNFTTLPGSWRWLGGVNVDRGSGSNANPGAVGLFVRYA
jgi:hypothetical protein